MSFMAALGAAKMGGGGGMPDLGKMPPVNMSNRSGIGDDKSSKVFRGITFGTTSSSQERMATSRNDTIKWGLLALGGLLAVKIWKG